MAVKYRLGYEVIVKSVDSSRKPTRGALVRYIFVLDRGKKGKEPSTMKNPTEATEKLTAGEYYMWSERNGRTTSDKNRKFLISENGETLTIVENKVR